MGIRIDYPCYHSFLQYSADGCDGCEHEMDCWAHFLKVMERNKCRRAECLHGNAGVMVKSKY